MFVCSALAVIQLLHATPESHKLELSEPGYSCFILSYECFHLGTSSYSKLDVSEASVLKAITVII